MEKREKIYKLLKAGKYEEVERELEKVEDHREQMALVGYAGEMLNCFEQYERTASLLSLYADSGQYDCCWNFEMGCAHYYRPADGTERIENLHRALNYFTEAAGRGHLIAGEYVKWCYKDLLPLCGEEEIDKRKDQTKASRRIRS